MESQELIVMTWITLAIAAATLGIGIWTIVVSRRKERPVPPLVSAQMLMVVGMTAVVVSGLVGDTAQLVLLFGGAVLGAFAFGRMWDPVKQNLRDVGLIKPLTTDNATGQNRSSQLNRAG